mmetsp:Transcript_24847/g.42059  ORF Transcript_24847/g.42059 Transcript_24847/m.42059 type:complete len:213 (-) Transcript_24847:300-938(-)
MNSQSEEEAVKLDQEQHPNCSYSTSIRQFFSFSSNSGQSNEVQKTIMRVCPGESPVPIFSKTENNSSAVNDEAEDGVINHFVPRQGHEHDFGGFDGIDSMINSFFGGGALNNSDDPFSAFIGNHFGTQHREGNRSPASGFGHPVPLPPRWRDPYSLNTFDDRGVSEHKDKAIQSVLQPPHAIPKGTSPTVGKYSGGGNSSLQGETVSPPENI